MLTERGMQVASSVIRSHRLWETYLHNHLSIPADNLHFSAERLEHITNSEMQEKLANDTDSACLDPHGKQIPD